MTDIISFKEWIENEHLTLWVSWELHIKRSGLIITIRMYNIEGAKPDQLHVLTDIIIYYFKTGLLVNRIINKHTQLVCRGIHPLIIIIIIIIASIP